MLFFLVFTTQTQNKLKNRKITLQPITPLFTNITAIVWHCGQLVVHTFMLKRRIVQTNRSSFEIQIFESKMFFISKKTGQFIAIICLFKLIWLVSLGCFFRRFSSKAYCGSPLFQIVIIFVRIGFNDFALALWVKTTNNNNNSNKNQK